MGEPYTVVVLRSAFWRLPGGRVFAILLDRFAEALRSMDQREIRFEWLGRYTDATISSDTVQWHSFDAIARHTCALDVPAELSQIKFRDMYSMGLPLLYPDDAWMQRLLSHMYEAWGQLSGEFATRIPSGEAVETSDWPWPPFYAATEDHPALLEYWFPLADHKRYPHVVLFHSLPALLGLVADTRWAEVSIRMRSHAR